MSDASLAAPGSDPASPVRVPADNIPEPYRRRLYLGVLIVAVLGIGAGLLAGTPTDQGLLATWTVYAIAGVGFYLLFGLSGQFAFSQGAFVGLGAYASVWAGKSLGFVGGFFAAIVICAVVATLLAFIARRSSAFYFAIATLAFGSIALVLFREMTWFTGPSGEVVNIARPDLFGLELRTDRAIYFLSLGVLVAGLLLVALIERSPLRRTVIAVRDNESVAAAAGIPTVWTRLVFFAVGSAFAGAAGALLAHRTGYLNTEAFALQLGIDLFLVLLLGGIGSMWGALLGAGFVVYAPHELKSVGQNQGLVYGILLVAVVLLLPDGLVGVIKRVRDAIGRFRR